MESGEKEEDVQWRLAVLIDDSELSFVSLRSKPMSLLAWFPKTPRVQDSEENTVLAVAKLSLLDTYDNVHEYQTKKGVQLRAANTTNCCFPHVTLVSYKRMDEENKDVVLMNLPEDIVLDTHTGLSRPTSPTILVASSFFLSSHGYSNMEMVWVRVMKPLPLERVVLGGGVGGGVSLSPATIPTVMQEMSKLLVDQVLVFRRGGSFFLPGQFQTEEEEEEEEGGGGGGRGGGRHGIMKLSVLDTSPVVQGQLTRETEIVVVPQNERNSVSLSPKSPPLPLHESSALEESGETRSLTASNCSASDFRNDGDYDEAPETLTSDPRLELLTHHKLKLHRNYILVPKQFALEHELLQYQTVILEAGTLLPGGGGGGGAGGGGSRGVADMVLSTTEPREESVRKKERRHAAILMWYNGQTELECYLPLTHAGYQFPDTVLHCAFVHPHLLHSLFHETLSPSQRYLISLNIGKKDGAVSDPPKAKVVSVDRVGVVTSSSPDLTSDKTKAILKEFFQQRTHLLMTGDIFSIDLEGGETVYYRLRETEPANSQRCDSSCLREINWQSPTQKKRVQYPLPSECPPCPLLPTPPYFSLLLPPGLDRPCLSLFSLLLPLLYTPHSLRPSRTPLILLTGPSGVGKRTVASAVARRVRAQLLELNCYNYTSESVPTAEKRLMADCEKALDCAPCLVLFRNIHVIAKDSKKDESRLAAVLLSFVEYVSEHNKKQSVDFPILFVATAPKRSSVPASVAMEILHTVDMTPPTESQRLAMLQGLARDYLTSPLISWTQLAGETAGFVLGDMVSLFSRANYCATSSALKTYGENAELAVSGVVLCQKHFQLSLTQLHTAHSDAIGAPKIPNVHWEDVGGLGDAKQEVFDAIQLPLTHPHLFTEGMRRSGVLLYGPPGTGKTLLAKAVATECGVHFMSVKGPELINMYVGQTEQNVRDIFTRARGAAPCIIFFDELDSIAPSRGKTGDASGVMDRVVSQLLAELDGLQKSTGVFVIGATNRVDLLEPSLLRPGRFDRLIYLGITNDVDDRIKILSAITRKFNLAPDVDLHDLATRCSGNVTGADLYALCSDALLHAVRQMVQGSKVDDEATLLVTRDHFLWALSQLTPSVSEMELEQNYHRLRKTEIPA